MKRRKIVKYNVAIVVIIAFILITSGSSVVAQCPDDTGDVDKDGDVDVIDFLDLIAAWGPCNDCPADFDDSGAVDIIDFLALLANWGNYGWSHTWGDISIDGPIYDILPFDYDNDGIKEIIVAGDFTEIGGITVDNSIAVYDSDIHGWSSLGIWPNLQYWDIEIRSLAIYKDTLYAGGRFKYEHPVNDDYRCLLARLNHETNIWEPLDFTEFDFGGYVRSMVVYQDNLYLGGRFDFVDPCPCCDWIDVNGICYYNDTEYPHYFTLGNGLDASDFEPNGGVYDMTVYDNGLSEDLYVGGFFDSVVGPGGSISGTHGIARWDGTWWSSVGGGLVRADPPFQYIYGIRALEVYNDNSGDALFIGGYFDEVAGDIAMNNIAKWNNTGWHQLISGSYLGLNKKVTAFAVHNDGRGPGLFVGGEFTTAGESTVNKIAMWDGNEWEPLGNGVTEYIDIRPIYTIQSFGNALYIGGSFEEVSNCDGDLEGIPANNTALWYGL